MMKALFNNLVISFIQLLPRKFIRIFAYKYVAGENITDVLNVIKTLNLKGFAVTVDILGEHTSDIMTANNIRQDYEYLITKIDEQKLDCNLSIKPSHLGMDISNECVINNMTHILQKASDNNNFIRIDMEDSTQTDATIDLYQNLKNNFDNIGIVFQAYLHRTEQDVKSQINIKDFNVRICKGIYKESPKIAIKERKKINDNFLKILRKLMENNVYVGIATHDLTLIKRSCEIIDKLKIQSNKFEFQVLYGVPMSGWLEKHLSKNYKVRIYVPYGKDWYDYSIRRLKENPDIAGHVIRDLFRK